MKKTILVICCIIIWIIGWGLVYYLNQWNKNWEDNWEYISYYKNGQIKEKWNYTNGERNWEFISYYENGQIESKWNFEEGIPIWEFISYYENGQLQWKCEFKNLNWYWECYLYDENWNFETKWAWWYSANWKINWEWTYYYENGNIAAKWIFKDEILNWESIIYYENGNIERKWNFENGQPVWELIYYYENGEIKEKMNFKNWILDWEYISYYENGQIEWKWIYKEGISVWKLIYYYENGEIKEKMNFKNWILDWEYTHYFEDGKITEHNYKNWKLDWSQTWYYGDGSIRFSWIYENWFWTKSYFDKNWNLIWTWIEVFTDELDEEYWEYKSIINWLEITYYNNWQTHKISNYKDWKLDWIQTLYYENGQTSSICKYANWIKDWKCLMYDGNWNNIKEIEIYYPVNDSNIIVSRVEIIWNCHDLPNSVASIYIDGEKVWISNVWYEWSINTSIPNIDDWEHTLLVEILDASWKTIWESDEIKFYINEDSEINKSLNYSTSKPYIIPDSAEIVVGNNSLIAWESTDLKITITKDDSPMKTYRWTIRIMVTDEQWNKIKDYEYTVPSQWMYTFQLSDLWTKEFQRWLEIKKEWKFYVEIQDINDNEEKVLWRQAITVIKS